MTLNYTADYIGMFGFKFCLYFLQVAIKKGRGVCGTAWEEKQTVIVPDVEQFHGHIACSSKSRSEIVVPVIKDDEIIAVIDVDSTMTNGFDEADKAGLEIMAEIVSPLFYEVQGR